MLIVDDYPGTAETAGKLLRGAGHECRSARSGAEALVVADAFEPEVAILDIGLPDIDGYALIDALRRRLAVRPPYVVAMSGRGHALTAAREIGFDECLLKPVDREQLVRVVELARQWQTPLGPHREYGGANSQGDR
ncbi:MAG TPA: response regulator [Kofleriaceae bacterium]